MFDKMKALGSHVAHSKIGSRVLCSVAAVSTAAMTAMTTVSAADVSSSTYDPMTTGFDNVVTILGKVWNLACGNPLLSTVVAACLVPVGCRAFKSVKRALK